MNDIVRSPSGTLATREPRNLALSYILCLVGFFTPLAGMHRLYLGRVGSGVIWLVTWGLCGVGSLVDLIMLKRMVDDTNRGADVW